MNKNSLTSLVFSIIINIIIWGVPILGLKPIFDFLNNEDIFISLSNLVITDVILYQLIVIAITGIGSIITTIVLIYSELMKSYEIVE